MSNQGIKNNGVNWTGTTNFGDVAPGMHGVSDPASQVVIKQRIKQKGE